MGMKSESLIIQTWKMINDIANNFGDSHPVSQNTDQIDNHPHFHDVDHRTIPYNFLGIPANQQMGIKGKILKTTSNSAKKQIPKI